jgi:anti-sigma factor RsiW
MCENRERLIGYVYDECDPEERRLIEAHLETCPTCRHEIRGLRGVRQDLLAWDVPASEPIWRPIAAVPQRPVWRAVPSWALAAAACATFMVGAAGGAATVALMPRSAPAVAELRETPARVATPASVTSDELAALETRVLAQMRAELDTRARASAGTAVAQNAGSSSNADLARRVNILTARQNDLYDRLLEFASETQGIRTKQADLERGNRMLVSYALGAAGAGGQ